MDNHNSNLTLTPWRWPRGKKRSATTKRQVRDSKIETAKFITAEIANGITMSGLGFVEANQGNLEPMN